MDARFTRLDPGILENKWAEPGGRCDCEVRGQNPGKGTGERSPQNVKQKVKLVYSC